MSPDSRLTLVLAMLSLAFLTACAPDGEDAPGAAPSLYVHSMDGAPASVDPAQAFSVYANTLVVNLYDTLYRYRYLARPYELAPNLASALPEFSEDGLTLTIPLRRGVRFVDDPAFDDGRGREVVAQDVVYSLLRHFDPAMRAQGGWLWQGRILGLEEWKAAGSDYDAPPAGLRALDAHTLQIRLTGPFPQIVHTLATGFSAVVPREAVDAYGRELGTRAVGSGPFRLLSLDRSRAVMERNPDFRELPISLAEEGFDPARDGALGLEAIEGRTPPLVDRVEVEFIAEDAARWNSFYAGETHYLKVPVAQFDQVLAGRDPARLKPGLADRFHVLSTPESGLVYTAFNMADPEIGHHPDPERDVRNRALRCAIVKGFDWATRNRQFYAGLGQVFPGVITPNVPEFDPTLERDSVTHDPDAARTLLARHGWSADNLPILHYGYPSSVTERQLFEQFRAFMENIGYPGDKIRPRVFATYGDYQRAFSNRELSLVTTSWTMDYPDAENTLQLYFGPNASPGSNISNFSDAEFDALYREAAPLPPSERRTELFRAMNRRVIDECAAITGLSRNLLLLWSREAIMLPDRAFVGGYAFRFVDLAPAGTP